MAVTVSIRRADYTGAGIYRTSESTNRTTLTGILLQVDGLQEAIDRKISVNPLPEVPDNPLLISLYQGTNDFTLKGAITPDTVNSVGGVHRYLDLRYAVLNWDADGLTSLVWTDEADATVTHTHDGYLKTATFQYNAGELGIFPFTLQFARGKIT